MALNTSTDMDHSTPLPEKNIGIFLQKLEFHSMMFNDLFFGFLQYLCHHIMKKGAICKNVKVCPRL